MRRIVVSTFTSLDGVMQAPGGPAEDPTGGFTLGGWTVPYFDEALGAAMGEIFGRPFDLLLGRKTYDIFAAHWPYISDPNDAFAAMFNRITKYVAIALEPKLDWNNSQWLGKDSVGGAEEAEGRGRSGPHGPGLRASCCRRCGRRALVDELERAHLPAGAGQGQAPVRRGRAALRAEDRQVEVLPNRRGRDQLHARQRGQDRRLRATPSPAPPSSNGGAS